MNNSMPQRLDVALGKLVQHWKKTRPQIVIQLERISRTNHNFLLLDNEPKQVIIKNMLERLQKEHERRNKTKSDCINHFQGKKKLKSG